MEKYRTLGKRFGALIIDSIVVWIINAALSFALLTIGDANSTLIYLGAALVNLLSVFYFIALHARYGQTIGKKVCGVKVVDDSEAPLNFGQSILRSLPQLIPALFVVTLINSEREGDWSTQFIGGAISVITGIFGLADVIVCLANDKRRTLHDFIAGTIVVRTDV